MKGINFCNVLTAAYCLLIYLKGLERQLAEYPAEEKFITCSTRWGGSRVVQVLVTLNGLGLSLFKLLLMEI